MAKLVDEACFSISNSSLVRARSESVFSSFGMVEFTIFKAKILSCKEARCTVRNM